MDLDCGRFSIAETAYSPGLRQPRHAHDYSNVTVLTAGELDEESEPGTYHARPSSVVVKGAGCKHADRISGFGAKTITIRLRDEGLVGSGTWAWFDDCEVVREALGLHRAVASRDSVAVEFAAAALIEIVTARTPAGGGVPGWLPAFRSALDEQFALGVRFDRLARDFGLHPVYASRAFRRHVGVTMREYVRDLRVRDARRQLSCTRRAIGAVAAFSGFADASHLSRTFSSLLGVTPKNYRRMTRG